jgi:predicted nucleic acid-binding protein
MERRRWRVFLDTSALIAGIISPTGAAHEVLRLCEAKVVEPVISRQVLTEADRNLSEKLPALIPDYRALLRHLSPHLIQDPSLKAVEQAGKVINRKDAPILAAAIEADVDYLITWNTRHFHKKAVRDYVEFKIVTPGEFLDDFRRSLPEE